MRKILLLLGVPTLFLFGGINAQVTFRIASLPSTTPPAPSIFISGDFEGWSGGDTPYQLERGPDSLFAITLQQMNGSIQFKFTRGSWATVEKGPNGEEIGNRIYAFGGNGDTVNVTIDNWADQSGISSTAAENVSIMSDDFWMPQLNKSRRVWIYVPPDYDSTDTAYPVLYMHDGQNLFDDSTSFLGEWGVDETLNTMHTESGFGLIVVGIENGGVDRIDEYSPWIHPQFGGGDGEAYVDFIAGTLKPFVDSAYRTMPDAGHTGIMGSSMGGLISQYAGIAHPDTFRKVGVFSPSFALFDSCYDHTASNSAPLDSRFYYLAGGLEGGNVPDAAQAMIDTMLAIGMPPDQMQLIVDALGTHSEGFWKEQFSAAVEWLFAGGSVGIDDALPAELPIRAFPNPASGYLTLDFPELSYTITVRILDVTGRVYVESKMATSTTIDVSALPAGLYFAHVAGEMMQGIIKVVIVE